MLKFSFLDVDWQLGDGTGGPDSFEMRQGNFPSKEACVEQCLTAVVNGVKANGVTVDTATETSCYCEFGETKRQNNKNFINTLIRPGMLSLRTLCVFHKLAKLLCFLDAVEIIFLLVTSRR